MQTSDMKTALYLDDIRIPTNQIPGHSPWHLVRNYDEFTKWITEHGVPDFISFDHDLGEEHMQDYYDQVAKMGFQYPDYEHYKEKTGMDCATWLICYCQDNNVPLGKVSVHSHNPVGTTNIQAAINGFKRHCGEPEDCFIMKHPFIMPTIVE